MLLSLGLLTGLAGGTPAALRPQSVAAEWMDQENAMSTATAASLPAPALQPCTESSLLGLGVKWSATVSWSAVSGITTYRMLAWNPATSTWDFVQNVTGTSFTFSEGLLGSLLNGLLGTLFGSANATAQLKIEYVVPGTQWSAVTAGQVAVKSVGGLLSGYRCA